MFLTVCNLILSPHPLGRSILDEARDQPIPGSFLKTLGTRLRVPSENLVKLHHYSIKDCSLLVHHGPREQFRTDVE